MPIGVPWLVRASLCIAAMALMGQVSEQDFQSQINTRTCDLYSACFVDRAGCEAAVDDFSDVSACTYDAQAAEDCLDGWNATTCNMLFAGTIPSACDRVYECDHCDPQDPLTEGLGNLSIHLTGTASTLCDQLDRDVSSAPTVLGNLDWGSVPGAGDHTEFHGVASDIVTLGPADAERIADLYPCGYGYYGFTGCANPNAELSDGDYIVISALVKGDFPLDDTTSFYQVGCPIDPDDDPSNNYVAEEPFLGDFFDGTQFFYELRTNGPSNWAFASTDATNNVFQLLESEARGTISGNTIFFLIPRGEASGIDVDYRVTVHQHLGDFGENGDTSADTEPPIDQDLRTVGESGSPFDGGVPDGGEPDGGEPDGGEPDGGEPSGETDGSSNSCGCRVASPESKESTAALALAVLGIATIARRRRLRRHA